MPCCSWTTGSPMRTSERSRTIASTLDRRADSRTLRRTTFAYNSASVTTPVSRRATRSPTRGARRQVRHARDRARRRRSHRPAPAEIRIPRSIAASSRGGPSFPRRSRRASVAARVAFQRGQRIVGAAIDLHGRNWRCRSRSRSIRTARELDAREWLQRAVKRVGRQKQLGGGSNGRALSPRRSFQRDSVSCQKRSIAPWTSPWRTTVACCGR